MNKFSAYSQIGFAVLLYVLSALTFIDYMYSLVIPDTVTAVENAFGKLVILIFMLVMAKFSMTAGKRKLKELVSQSETTQAQENSLCSAIQDEKNASMQELDAGQQDLKKEADK